MPKTLLAVSLMVLLLPAAPAGAQRSSAEAGAEPVQTASSSREGSASADSLASGLIRADSVATALLAQPAVAPPETAAAVPAPSARVLLGGREIFRVRVGRDGLDPTARAAAIRARLTRAITDKRVSADSLRLIRQPDGIQVQLGPYFLWLITPGDSPSHDPAELSAALARLPGEIRDGVERERAQRRPLRVALSVGVALLLTLLALALARLLVAGSGRWQRWLPRVVSPRLPAIRLRSFEVLSKDQVAGAVTGILARVDVVIGLLLLYWYLTAVFSLFPWTQGWSARLVAFAVLQSLSILRSIGSGIPGLFAIALIYLLFRWLNRLAARVFDAIANGSLVLGGFHPELAAPSRTLVSILLWLIALAVAYPYVPGSSSRAVQGISLFFGVVFSLGSTGIVGNLMAGIVLTYSRSFRVGDRVRIGDHVGDVTSLGFFATKMRTIRNEEVTIPNGQVAAGSILNYTRLADDGGLILHTRVTIGYDVDWRQVHALLIEAAGRVGGIEKEPAPWVLQRSLDDNYPTYELCCVTRDSHAQLRLYSDLHAEIQDAFSRAGVEILSPAYHAIRDANAPVLPKEPAGPRRERRGFRLDPRS